jgi:hypothetical protein
MLDLGSGGGSRYPAGAGAGRPSSGDDRVTFAEAAFLREAARELGLSAVVETARFEDVARRSEHGTPWISSQSARFARTPHLAVAGSF